MNPLSLHTATIAIDTALSQAIALEGRGILAILMPAAWDTAAITLSVSQDGSTYVPATDIYGTEISISAAASIGIVIEPGSAASAYGWKYAKIRSGTVGTPVDQTAARTLIVALKPI